MLFEMLTGTRPFAALYPAAVLYAVLHEAARRLAGADLGAR